MMSHPPPLRRSRAFTLIELIVVILILGVLAAISTLAYGALTDRANSAAAQSNLRNAAQVLLTSHEGGDFTREAALKAFAQSGVEVTDGLTAAGWTVLGADEVPRHANEIALGFAGRDGVANNGSGARVAVLTSDGKTVYARTLDSAAGDVAPQTPHGAQTAARDVLRTDATPPPPAPTEPPAPTPTDPPAPPAVPTDSSSILTLTFDTSAPSCPSSLPLLLPVTGYTSLVVDWGDGTTTVETSGGAPRHTYADSRAHTITVDGQFSTFGADVNGMRCVTSVDSWGDGTGTTSVSFEKASNLTAAPRIPASTTSLKRAFANSTFSGDISGWDTSNVTNMNEMFTWATFNGDISGWDTSNVTNMSSMFNWNKQFNGDVSGWDTSNVTNMSSMFSEAASFNADLSQWDTSAVTSMTSMFKGAVAFNSDLSNWNTSAVTKMSSMFAGASAFNGDVRAWDTSRVTALDSLFSGATVFNQDLSNWNTSSATQMNGMFTNAKAFSGDISRWDTSRVFTMNSMFNGAAAFNNDISAWNVRAVTNVEGMFSGATSFNQDLSGWDLTKATKRNNFAKDTTSWTLPKPKMP